MGTVIGLGKVLERDELHQDPFANAVIKKEQREQLEEIRQKVKEANDAREELR